MSVVNQYGMYLDGVHRQAVIDAVAEGRSFAVIDGVRVEIVAQSEDVIKIKVGR